MTVVDHLAYSATPYSWVFLILGVIFLPFGIVFVARPRRSGEVWRKVQQAVQPYWTIPKVPPALVAAVGCLALLVSAGMFYAAWFEFR